MSFHRDLLMRGDFENGRYEGTEDSTWGSHSASVELRSEPSGNSILMLAPTAVGKAMSLYPEPYFRKLTGRSYSLIADIRVQQGATIQLAIKDKPGSDASEKLTPSWEGRPVGQQVLPPGPAWQRVRFDFTRSLPADGEPAPMRPILNFAYTNAKAAGVLPIEIDNMALVEWSDRPEADLPPATHWLWTHQEHAGATMPGAGAATAATAAK